MAKHAITTIEGLAHMITEGFKTTASKEDIKAVHVRQDRVEVRLDRIAHLLLADQGIVKLTAERKNRFHSAGISSDSAGLTSHLGR